jgi:hypothetical protein
MWDYLCCSGAYVSCQIKLVRHTVSSIKHIHTVILHDVVVAYSSDAFDHTGEDRKPEACKEYISLEIHEACTCGCRVRSMVGRTHLPPLVSLHFDSMLPRRYE